MNKKEIIIVGTIIVVMLIGIVFLKSKSKDYDESAGIATGQTEETTNKIATKKENDKFKIYNTDIKPANGETKLKATIENKTEQKTEEQRVNIILLDKDEKEIGKMTVLVPALKSGDSTEVASEILTQYDDVVDFKIE